MSEIIANAIGQSISFFESAATVLCIRDECVDRQRNIRAAAGSSDALNSLHQVLRDADKVMRGNYELAEVADLLFHGEREVLPVGTSPIVHPDLVERYISPRNPTVATSVGGLFSASLVAVQAEQALVDELSTKAKSTMYLTENIGQCLLNSTCALQDNANQFDLAVRLLKTRRSDVIFDVVEAFGKMGKALEYWTLADDVPITLPAEPTLVDLRQQLASFTILHDEVVTSRGGLPTVGTVYYTFNKATNPRAFAALLAGDTANFTIPPATNPMFRDVRISSHDVRAYVYPATSANGKSISVQISKGSYSMFYPIPAGSKPKTFMHTDIAKERLYSFVYDANTCADLSEPCTSAECQKTDLLSVSPYGEWHVELRGDAKELLAEATELRVAFKVRWYSSNVGETDESQNTAMFGADLCTVTSGAETCFGTPGASPVAPDECNGQRRSFSPTQGSSTDDEDDGMSVGASVALGLGLSLLFVGTIVGVLVWRKKLDQSAAHGKLRTSRSTANAAYDVEDDARSGTASVRCPQCRSKVQFCICNRAEERVRHLSLPKAGLNTALPMYGEEPCAYISASDGRGCAKLQKPGSLFCTEFHACPTPNCGLKKPRKATVCAGCEAKETASALPKYGEEEEDVQQVYSTYAASNAGQGQAQAPTDTQNEGYLKVGGVEIQGGGNAVVVQANMAAAAPASDSAEYTVTGSAAPAGVHVHGVGNNADVVFAVPTEVIQRSASGRQAFIVPTESNT